MQVPNPARILLVSIASSQRSFTPPLFHALLFFTPPLPAMLTRSLLDALLARYEAMAEAARANDWDRLSALEREAATLRDTARAGADAAAESAALATLPAAEADALRVGIERLLALDAEIRTHADPFLASVRKLLAGGRQERAVRNAYGALAP